MKKYFLLILFCCLGYSISIKAQTFLPNSADRLLALDFFGPVVNVLDINSISNYHFFNPYVFNPAMAGIEDKRQLNFDLNRQFNYTASLSFEQPISSINSAIGVQYEYSLKSFGKMHRYGLAYNYGFRWKENSQLRIGLQFSQINIKVDNYSVIPLEWNKWYNFPSLDLGMAFQHKELRLGVSVQNLVPKKYARFNEQTESFVNKVNTERTVNVSAANTFKLAKSWDWSLAFLLRFNSFDVLDEYYNYYEPYYFGIESNKNQHDFSSYLTFRKKYTIGTTYRVQYDPVWIGFVGVKLKEKLNLQFSYNMKKEEYTPRFWEALTQYQF